MPSGLFQDLFRLLRRTRALEGTDLSDGDLLERFLEQRDEAAFEALVQRHGPMVLGVCQRVAGDSHAAEDAFQATFLVLARTASGIRKQASVGSWLYGVAQRIACKARAKGAARRDRERRAATMPHSEPLDELTWQELRDVLDEELGRLPEKYRAAVVLCYLEGKTHEQAARELGWVKSSLTSRLAKARELLRDQLTRRGVALSAGALATALAEKATAAPVSALLSINITKAATSVAAGANVSGLLSTQAIALAEDAMKTMIGIQTKLVLVVMALGLAVSIGFAGYAAWMDQARPNVDALPPGPVAVGLVAAEEFMTPITKVDGDKVTFQKYKKSNKDDKKFPPEKDGDPVTLPVAKGARITMANFKFDAAAKTLSWSPGDAIEGGLKNTIFKNIKIIDPEKGKTRDKKSKGKGGGIGFAYGTAGLYAKISTSDDGKTITAIEVYQIAPIAQQGDKPADAQQFKGTWKATSIKGTTAVRIVEAIWATNYATKVEDRNTIEMTVDKIIVKAGDKTLMELEYKLNPAAKPKEIDLKLVKAPPPGKKTPGKEVPVGTMFKGIYSLEADKLTIAWIPVENQRPTDFTMPKGPPPIFIQEWQRMKPAK